MAHPEARRDSPDDRMSSESSDGRATSLALDLPGEPRSVSRARHATRECAERTGADPESVALAVSEAVGNSIIHGYRDGRRGTIRVEARLTGTMLSVIVRDSGVGMSPNPGTNGLGVGLPLIGRVSDHLDIESHTEGGTRVAMWFRRVAIEHGPL